MPHIIVVDDDRETRKAMQAVLTRAGHAVRTANEGTAALLMLAEVPADVVITDIFMPATDGLEIIREIRSVHPATRIIAVTGYPGLGDPLNTAKTIGADITLRKPLMADQLLAAVNEVLKQIVAPKNA